VTSRGDGDNSNDVKDDDQFVARQLHLAVSK